MNEKIIIQDIKNLDQKLETLKKNSYEYDWSNYIIHFIFRRDKILVKIKNGVIYAVIPYSTENRKFVGKFYEDNGIICMEGSFELLSHVKLLYGLFLGIICFIWGFVLSLIFDDAIFLLEELSVFLMGIFVLTFFGIWYLFRYRNRKYEQRILSYIIDILLK